MYFSVHQAFEHQISRHEDGPALVTDGTKNTESQLCEVTAASSHNHRLRYLAEGCGTIAGMCAACHR